MPRIRHKIAEVLNIQPYKDYEGLTDTELVNHEAECRREIVRLVLSLTIHLGTCTAHGVLSVGTSLPLRLPVVVWIAYSLTKTAKRHRALKAEIQTSRSGIKLKKLPERRFTALVALTLLSPILSALGVDIINEVVCTLTGSDALLCGNSNGVIVGEHNTPDDSGFRIVTASEQDCPYTELSVTEAASGAAIDELLEQCQDQLIRGVSDEFAELVAVMDTGNGGNVTLPGYYQIRCNACHKQITNGFSCTECHDFDLCRDCYVGVRHQDAKRHMYNEFKFEEELTQIQRIVGSLRRENVVIDRESRRGGYIQCNKCDSTVPTPVSSPSVRILDSVSLLDMHAHTNAIQSYTYPCDSSPTIEGYAGKTLWEMRGGERLGLDRGILKDVLEPDMMPTISMHRSQSARTVFPRLRESPQLSPRESNLNFGTGRVGVRIPALSNEGVGMDPMMAIASGIIREVSGDAPRVVVGPGPELEQTGDQSPASARKPKLSSRCELRERASSSSLTNYIVPPWNSQPRPEPAGSQGSGNEDSSGMLPVPPIGEHEVLPTVLPGSSPVLCGSAPMSTETPIPPSTGPTPDASTASTPAASASSVSDPTSPFRPRTRDCLGELSDLYDAIQCQTQAVQCAPDNPDKPSWLKDLGCSYMRRSQHLSELLDLQNAIECQAQAVQLTPDCHPDNPSRLHHLGNSYRRRFKRLGNLSDLDDAIQCQTRAVWWARDDSDKSSWLKDLGCSYMHRFQRLGELSDLTNGIECHTQAMQLTPDSHPDKLRSLKIGNSYYGRFKWPDELSDPARNKPKEKEQSPKSSLPQLSQITKPPDRDGGTPMDPGAHEDNKVITFIATDRDMSITHVIFRVCNSRVNERYPNKHSFVSAFKCLVVLPPPGKQPDPGLPLELSITRPSAACSRRQRFRIIRILALLHCHSLSWEPSGSSVLFNSGSASGSSQAPGGIALRSEDGSSIWSGQGPGPGSSLQEQDGSLDWGDILELLDQGPNFSSSKPTHDPIASSIPEQPNDPPNPPIPLATYSEGYSAGHVVGYSEGYSDGVARVYAALALYMESTIKPLIDQTALMQGQATSTRPTLASFAATDISNSALLAGLDGRAQTEPLTANNSKSQPDPKRQSTNLNSSDGLSQNLATPIAFNVEQLSVLDIDPNSGPNPFDLGITLNTLIPNDTWSTDSFESTPIPAPQPQPPQSDQQRSPSPELALGASPGHESTETHKHQCETCGKLFRRPYLLEDHKRTHHGGESSTYSCEFEGCTRVYNSHSNMRRHYKLHLHGNNSRRPPPTSDEQVLVEIPEQPAVAGPSTRNAKSRTSTRRSDRGTCALNGVRFRPYETPDTLRSRVIQRQK